MSTTIKEFLLNDIVIPMEFTSTPPNETKVRKYEAASEEQKARIEAMKDRAQGEYIVDDGFLEALNSTAVLDWGEDKIS